MRKCVCEILTPFNFYQAELFSGNVYFLFICQNMQIVCKKINNKSQATHYEIQNSFCSRSQLQDQQ